MTSENFEMMGDPARPELAAYVVAVRLRDISGTGSHDTSWHEISPGAIEAAQIRYDAGTVELCQGANRTHGFLYGIPRRIRARRPYPHTFRSLWEDEFRSPRKDAGTPPPSRRTKAARTGNVNA
ncbi:MAG: hypothetical protein HQL37_09250 [Alphaproteobacteria bacterium]|nr:hypothetical protein [Alphaproteobacteria bacterium]